MGWGPCCHPEFLRPWHKGLGSRPPRGGEGEERPPGHSVTFRGPQRRAPGPSPPRTAPPSAPWTWRGYEVSDPFALWGPGGVEGIGRTLAEGRQGVPCRWVRG